MSSQKWRLQARCAEADPEAWFPPPVNEKSKADRETRKKAFQVCRACPVRNECLQFALENNIQHGIWGGMAERERRQLRKRMMKRKASR